MSAEPTIVSLPLTVVYGQVDSQVKAGKYDRKDNRITSENFPTNKTGTVRLKYATFVHFPTCQTSDDVVRVFAELGLKLGNADEILAVGVEYPSIQKECPVVALGSVLEPEVKSSVKLDPYRSVIFLSVENGLRELSLSSWGGVWRSNCRFLGFPIPAVSE